MPVYIIRQGLTGPVKIGVANDVVKRLRQLQTNQPIVLRILRVLDGDRSEEGALHRRFAAQRMSGEWFTFSPEMCDGDLGLADLPIPLVKRNLGRNFCDNAWGREQCLHHEILTAIGGADALAKRVRQPPWVVVPNIISPLFWSATVLLLIEAERHDITVDMMMSAQADRFEQTRLIEANNAKIEAARQLEDNKRREREWLKKHGAAAAWWTLTETEDATTTSEAGASA